MHASLAFLNGAGGKRRSSSDRNDREELRLLKTLLSTVTVSTARTDSTLSAADPGKPLDRGKSKDGRQGDEESKAQPFSKPGGFENDPKDPTNPNEARERHLKKIKR